MVIVRKHCDFWLKVFKKLIFLIKTLNKNQQFSLLQATLIRTQLTKSRLTTLTNVTEYLTLYKQLDVFVCECRKKEKSENEDI
jgi:hypothetical protein